MNPENSAKDVFEMLDLEGMTPDEQADVLVDIQELITQGVMVRVVERMNDETRAAFEQLLATEADEETVTAFLEHHVSDMDAVVAETVADLQGDILSATGTNE